MSLLDNILSSIDKTNAQRRPTLSRKEQEMRAKAKEQERKEREATEKWKAGINKRLDGLVADEKATMLVLPPVAKIYRLFIQEAAEARSLVSHTFGRGHERVVVAFKREHAPSLTQIKSIDYRVDSEMTEAEIEALIEQIKSEPEPTAEEMKRQREAATAAEKADSQRRAGEAVVSPPPKNYRNKEIFAKLDRDADKLIVLGTEKRDLRTIEQIQEDMKRKKGNNGVDKGSKNKNKNNNNNNIGHVKRSKPELEEEEEGTVKTETNETGKEKEKETAREKEKSEPSSKKQRIETEEVIPQQTNN
jgi:regulator of extracellular matrix RemA (YlzA/DUF370 family)